MKEVMPKAIWNNQVIAEAPANETRRVERNVYFPLSAVGQEFLRPSDTHTSFVWKGIASYYDVVADGQVNEAAAWYYPEPSSIAAHIKDHAACCHGVRVGE